MPSRVAAGTVSASALLALVGMTACDAGLPPPREPTTPTPAKAPGDPWSVRTDGETTTPGATTKPIAGSDAVAMGVDAGVPADAAPPPEPVVIPPELAKAPAWIGRTYLAGMIRRDERLTTYTLRRAGTQAVLEISDQSRRGGGMASLDPGDDDAWSDRSPAIFLGEVSERGDRLTFVASGSVSYELQCRRTSVKAAAASAARTPSPPRKGGEDCGDEGRWKPAKTTSVKVLLCSDDPREWNQIALMPAPGIEWLHVNDDCSMQGGGWRLIGKDGAIVAPRAGG